MYEYACQVTRVVDGDTVDVILDLGFSILHKCRVRLYGIDTPESRTRDKDEKARGKLASKFLEQPKQPKQLKPTRTEPFSKKLIMMLNASVISYRICLI